ncbi:MAG: type II secretion system protein GspF [Deltaproteobacteria bacterium]|nr:MAG: type II secretion system protein GspF [Deltaproteobacteria bacterium]
MPVFQYKAINSKGKQIKGIITADGLSSAREKLRQQSIFPIEVKEVAEDQGSRKSFFDRVLYLIQFRSIDPTQVTVALRQLAALVSSGLPLVECLDAVIEQTEHTRLRTIFTQIKEKVTEGVSLSQAMSSHPNVFSEIYVNMVKAGETSGTLDIILTRLADFSEARLKLSKKIESALTYPIFLIMISTIIVIFLVSFVMPKIIGIFEGMKMTLPWSTKLLISFSLFMKRFWWLVLMVLIGIISGISLWIKSEKGKRIWDKIKLKMPVIGPLYLKAVLARFTRTLSILLKSGIKLVDALEIARFSMGSVVLEEAIENAIKYINEGQSMAVAMKKSWDFPPLMIQLIRAGEISGSLEEMLAKIAEIYENLLESSIDSLTSILEPVAILIMGLVVGYIVMSVLIPIFQMTGAIH